MPSAFSDTNQIYIFQSPQVKDLSPSPTGLSLSLTAPATATTWSCGHVERKLPHNHRSRCSACHRGHLRERSDQRGNGVRSGDKSLGPSVKCAAGHDQLTSITIEPIRSLLAYSRCAFWISSRRKVFLIGTEILPSLSHANSCSRSEAKCFDPRLIP